MLLICGKAQAELPGMTARDCVAVRYIDGVWMNRQGTRVAYLVRSPNINQNRNDFQIYVKDIADGGVGQGVLLYAGEGISDIAWLGDGTSLSMLLTAQDSKSIVIVNVETKKQEVAADAKGITQYSLNDSGDAVVYVLNDMASGNRPQRARTERELASGYRVSFGEDPYRDMPGSSLYIRRRTADGWSSAIRISIRDPISGQILADIPFLNFLSLSPNGNRMSLRYGAKDVPAEWKQSPWVRSCIQDGSPLQTIMVVYDFDSGKTTLALRTVWPDSSALWARDSKSFLVNAHSPVGSTWEQEDIRDHRISGPDANLFWVNVDTGKVEEIYRRVPDHHEEPLFWGDDGDIVIHASGDRLLRIHHEGETWKQADRVDLPHTREDRFGFLTSSENSIVGIRETVSDAPNLFIYQPGESSVRILTDLNPQLRGLRFAPVEDIHWVTSNGLEMNGLLLKPPDYVEGKRYPLVIQTKGDQGSFTCDSGQNHDPSFAPQPIANAGMLYLIRTVEPGFNYQVEQEREPKGYPGQIGEAVQQMDIWDSAVSALSRRGLVDPSRVGIIGFSRTGWYVDFILTHSPVHYAAATTADNAQYSLSEYWLVSSGTSSVEQMYGGPPFGRTRENWNKYSISFNLDRVHTPLLMEQMGYGQSDENPNLIPLSLACSYEVLTGLTRLHKPVEAYYYPNEVHQPDHPQARLASLQRNVDWYRFWLLGYVDHAAEKKDQYVRWFHLKDLQNEDARTPVDTTPREAVDTR